MAINRKKLRKLVSRLDPESKVEMDVADLKDELKMKDYSEAVRQLRLELLNVKALVESLDIPDGDEIKKESLLHVKQIEDRFTILLKDLKDDFITLYSTFSKSTNNIDDTIQDLDKTLKETRIELLSKIAGVGGGSMNQQIKVNGDVATTRYADINIIASGATVANDDAKKTTNITIPTGGGSAEWGDITGTLSSQTDLQNALNAKQDTLVSATNIKTINGSSLLGSGDLVVGGSSYWTINADNSIFTSNSSYTGTGVYNFAAGLLAGSSLTSGAQNVLIGIFAGKSATTGDNLVLVGNGGQNITTGGQNIILGSAGNVFTDGSNNLYIGHATETANGSLSHTMNIKNCLFGIEMAGNTLDDTQGKIGIGTRTPGYKLDVVGDVNITGAFRVNGTSVGGSGDVNGPASATDGNVAVFDGATGKLIRDSSLTLSGTNTGDQTVTITAAESNEGISPVADSTYTFDTGALNTVLSITTVAGIITSISIS